MKIYFQKFYKHILLFIVIAILGSYAVSALHQSQKKQYLEMQTKLLEAKYNTNYKYLKIVSNDIYEMYRDNDTIISILQEAQNANSLRRNELRNKLYNLLKKRYIRLRNMGVEQLHFHLRDNTSFLRMHKPDKFGDDLSSVRQSVALTNKSKTFTEGFEVGRTMHGFRFVYPMFNKEKEHIGSVEISFSSQHLITIISENTFNDIHFIVDKEVINKIVWSKDKYQPTIENANYFIEKDYHFRKERENFHDAIKNKEFREKISKKMKTHKAFSIEASYDSNAIAISFVPITDISRNNILAYIVVYKNSEYLKTINMQKYYFFLVFYSSLFLVFIFGFYVINSQDRLEKMAHFDFLTKLPNRSYFYIEFQRELKRARRYKTKLALLFIDLDGFKAVNDTYGHKTGDQLLKEVAERITDSVRDIDIVARLGGDEFVVLLPDILTSQESLLVAQKIISSLNNEFLIVREPIFIGASIGIAIYPEHGKDIDELIKNADNIMYNVKNSGKNSVQIYKEESL